MIQDAATKAALETLYNILLPAVAVTQRLDTSLHCQTRSLIVELARVLDKPCPVQTRAERRQARTIVLD